MIHTCTCKHPYQDRKHGKQKRVFNYMGKDKEGKTTGIARCTVCSHALQRGPDGVLA